MGTVIATNVPCVDTVWVMLHLYVNPSHRAAHHGQQAGSQTDAFLRPNGYTVHLDERGNAGDYEARADEVWGIWCVETDKYSDYRARTLGDGGARWS